jgi:hypothetical protein
MSLVVFRVVCVHMRVHIKCFKVISVNDPTNWLVSVSPTIALRGSLTEVVLKFSIRESSRIGS